MSDRADPVAAAHPVAFVGHQADSGFVARRDGWVRLVRTRPVPILIFSEFLVARKKAQSVKIRELEARVDFLKSRLTREKDRTDEATRAQNKAASGRARAENRLASSHTW